LEEDGNDDVCIGQLQMLATGESLAQQLESSPIRVVQRDLGLLIFVTLPTGTWKIRRAKNNLFEH
jgi:hypothetical protein